MRIIITMPGSDIDEGYFEEVSRQIDEGYTSGHVDLERNWTTDKGPEKAADATGRDDNTPAESESPTEAQRAALVKAWQEGAEHGARKCTFAAEGEQCSYNPYIEEVQS